MPIFEEGWTKIKTSIIGHSILQIVRDGNLLASVQLQDGLIDNILEYRKIASLFEDVDSFPGVVKAKYVASKIIEVRNCLISKDYDEAYHNLYKMADPRCLLFEPWKQVEEIAKE